MRAGQVESVHDADKTDPAAGKALQELKGFCRVPAQPVQSHDGHRIGSWLTLIEQGCDLRTPGSVPQSPTAGDAEVLDDGE